MLELLVFFHWDFLLMLLFTFGFFVGLATVQRLGVDDGFSSMVASRLLLFALMVRGLVRVAIVHRA